MIKCSKCGESVEDGKNFCSNCGNSLTQQEGKTGKTIVGGILLIIVSSFCLVAGFYDLIIMMNILGVISSIFAFWAFAIGLTAGIFCFKRMRYQIVIIGCAFILVSACIQTMIGLLTYTRMIGLALGISNLILGILSIVFITTSKNEF